MKDVEKSIIGNSELCSAFKSRMEKLPDNVVIIGSHSQIDNRKEKVKKACFPLTLGTDISVPVVDLLL